jgi:hypothetical protein
MWLVPINGENVHIENSGVKNLNQIRLVRSLSEVTEDRPYSSVGCTFWASQLLTVIIVYVKLDSQYPRAGLIQLESQTNYG